MAGGLAAIVTLGLFGEDAGAAQRGRGDAGPPPPCGPATGLGVELRTNVAADSRCFELRMYTADPTRDGVGQFKGGINELHQRFREKEVELFEKHGAEVVAVWQDLGNPRTLVYMLAFRDRAHREEVWNAFNADPEWTELRTKYFVPLESPTVMFMSASDYSPLK
jgi:hypothetical protein